MAQTVEVGVAPVPGRSTAPISRSRWFIVGILLLAVTTAFFDRINISVLFTDMSFLTTLGIKGKPAMMGLLMTTFVFAYGISAVLLSFLSDFVGPRKTLALITIVLAVAMGWMGMVTAYGAMVFGRVILGVAEGPQFGSANALVKRWFPPKEQSFANSIWTIGSPVGSALGFPLVFYLVAHYGWQASFHVLAILNAVIVLPVIWWCLKDFPSPEVAAAYSSKSKECAMSFRDSLGMFIRDWRFWMLAIYDCGAMIYLWGFNSWLPAYLRLFRHLNLARAGFYSALPFLLMLIGEVVGAKLSDKLQRRAIFCFVGLIAAGVCILIAAMSPGATAAAWYLAWSAFFWGATVPTLFALGFQIIPAKVTAAGFGVYAGLANLVGATAPWVMGLIIGQAGNYNHGLAVLVLSCIILAFPMVPLLRKY
jgi:sugar phosphate permease